MKKRIIGIIALVLCAVMLLTSCAAKKGEAETTDAKNDENKQTEKAEISIDFATVTVSGFKFVYMGGEKETITDGEGSYVSSKPGIATVDKKGNITANAPGVTLVGYEKDGKATAVAVCVFAEGDGPDRTSGEGAEVVEIGGKYTYTAPVSDVQYSSSNSAVVDVSAAPEFSFVGSGYACITCASVSRPFTYSFIVYDRTVE